MELTLFEILSHGIERKSTLDQGLAKVTGWFGNSLGTIIRNVRPYLPQVLADELGEALAARNFLAHHFLREWAVITPSTESTDAALADLDRYSTGLDALNRALEDHMRSQGWEPDPELDEDTQREIDALRPTTWR
jgi:hypothetical protein